jgi:ATP-dependent Clp protease ATP-binding subunit ClpB
VTLAARDAIANQGYDPIYGARPLKRVIQQQIQNQLATEILKGAMRAGSKVTIDYRLGDFVFTPSSPDGDHRPERAEEA